MSSYTKQNFENDQILKAEQLNHIEEGVERASKSTSFLSPSVTLEGGLISCSPLENSLLDVTSHIEAFCFFNGFSLIIKIAQKITDNAIMIILLIPIATPTAV